MLSSRFSSWTSFQSPSVIASWLDLMLHVLVIDQVRLYSGNHFPKVHKLAYNHIQALHYFRQYPSDKYLNKTMVVLMIVCDTIVVAGTCADAYFVGPSNVPRSPRLTFA
jgi:hypothetical protein